MLGGKSKIQLSKLNFNVKNDLSTNNWNKYLTSKRHNNKMKQRPLVTTQHMVCDGTAPG